MVEQSPEKIKEILAASSTTVKITNKHNKIVPMIQVVIGKENSTWRILRTIFLRHIMRFC